MAVLNLSAGLVLASLPRRQSDLDSVHQWTRSWLTSGTDIYTAGPDATYPDYPPHAIVALAPLGVLPRAWAIWSWSTVNLVLAVVAPLLAVRIVWPRAAGGALLLPVLMFLCWGGFRTLLQFSLLTLVAGLLAMRLADRRPALSGIFLGLSLMKPQMAAPFVLWAIFARRWRVVALGLTAVVAGLGIYCLRAGASPVAVVQRYAEILHMYYVADEDAMMVGLAQLRPLIVLAVQNRDVASAAAIALALGLLIAIGLLGFAEGRHKNAMMIGAPPLVCIWSLLTFYHLTYGFVLLLPVATLLILANDPPTRFFRTVVFWTLQGALMVDVPSLWTRVAPMLTDYGPRAWPAHADRLLMLALLACVWALAARGPFGKHRAEARQGTRVAPGQV